MDDQNPAFQFVKEIDIEVEIPVEFVIKNSKEIHLAAEKAELMAKLADVEKKIGALWCWKSWSQVWRAFWWVTTGKKPQLLLSLRIAQDQSVTRY